MALFKISKGTSANLKANRPYANEGNAYFTPDDGKFYIDIAGDGTNPGAATPTPNATIAIYPEDVIAAAKEIPSRTISATRIPLNAYYSDNAKKADELKNPLIFGEKTFDGTSTQEITAADLHIIDALSFLGTTNTAIDTAARKNNPEVYIPIIPTTRTASNGSVVMYENSQYYWDSQVNNGEWILLSSGDASSYKLIQEPIADANAIPSTSPLTTFVSSVTQDKNGNISVTKSPLDTSGTWSGNAITATHAGDAEYATEAGTAAAAITLTNGGTWTWTNGTTAGPTASLSIGGKTTAVAAVPSASTSISGVMTTGEQSFAGLKNFTGAMTIKGTGNGILNIQGVSASVDYVYLDVNGAGVSTRSLILQSGNASTGNVGIGTTTPTEKLEVNGNVKATKFIGPLQGNADTAIQFSAAKSVTLTGDITGTASSQAGWSVATTIGNGKVTNAKLANSFIKVAGNTIYLGESIAADTLRTSLGLANAMHFIGKATEDIEDGSTTDPVISGYDFDLAVTTKPPFAGDIVIDKDNAYEYVWSSENKWERLGGDGSYKIIQTPVSSPSTNGDALAFIDTISQDANGNITATSKNVQIASNLQNGILTNTTQTLGGDKTLQGKAIVEIADAYETDIVFKALSSNTINNDRWVGRSVFGASNLGVSIGTYNRKALLAAQSWTNAKTNAGPAYAPLYINTNSNQAIYLGANGATDTGTLAITGDTTTANGGNIALNGTATFNKNVIFSGGTISLNATSCPKFDSAPEYILGITAFGTDGGKVQWQSASDVSVGYATSAGDSTKIGGYTFANLEDRYVNVNGDTMTDTLNARSVVPTADSTYNSGSDTNKWSHTYTDYVNTIDASKLVIFDDVSGTAPSVPSVSTNNAVPRYNGTTGALKNSTVTISDGGIVTATGFTGNLTGVATNATADASGNTITSTYASELAVSGSTITLKSKSGASLGSVTISTADTKNTAGSTNLADTKLYLIGATSQAANPQTYSNSAVFISASNVLMGAAWNDYAEYRQANTMEAGRCICEDKSGIMRLTTERMMKGCEIISDTFGFAIGETEKNKTPIAVSGRVLAYTDKDRNTFEIGMPVCSGHCGTVSQMTEEEARMYPWCIIGTVSEIPDYEEWGDGKVKVDNRIWIRIR